MKYALIVQSTVCLLAFGAEVHGFKQTSKAYALTAWTNTRRMLATPHMAASHLKFTGWPWDAVDCDDTQSNVGAHHRMPRPSAPGITHQSQPHTPVMTVLSLLRPRQQRHKRHLQQHADVSYRGYSAARSIEPSSSGPRSQSALTYRAAEAVANAQQNVIQRVVAPENRQSYAIAGPFMGNSSADEAVLPRTKSGVDLPNGPYVTSGTISAGILAIGGASVAQTYEGAVAAATTDSVFLYREVDTDRDRIRDSLSRSDRDSDGDIGLTAIAANYRTPTPHRVQRAGARGSFGATSQPVGSLAMSGSANGDSLLAQARDAVALAQVERSSTAFYKRFERDVFHRMSGD